MTILQYLTSPSTGCCTTSELMAFSKIDKAGLETLKKYAREEMNNKGIAISEAQATK